MRRLDMPIIGRRLASARALQDLTQAQLAAASGITQRTVCLAESGARGGLSMRSLAAMAQVLQVSLDFLVYGACPQPNLRESPGVSHGDSYKDTDAVPRLPARPGAHRPL